MNKDIANILHGWSYDPGQVNARWITGADGLPKVQLRLDLGVLQMELEGRPDGKTPNGSPSLLDYYLDKEEKFGDGDQALVLDEKVCMVMQQEAVQYYYRYLAFSSLGYLDGVVRDTDHNLALFNLVARRAVDDDLAWQFLQFYPYVRMMNARALAEKNAANNNITEAIEIVRQALADIRDFCAEYDDVYEGEGCDEEDVLEEILKNLQSRKPKSKLERLQENLSHAIAQENYERAAALRDELKKIGPELA